MDIQKVTDQVTWVIWSNIMRRMKPETLVKCKYCGSTDVVKFGTYKGVQRWWCKDCKRKFVDADTLYKMKTPIKAIASALSGYYGGMSLDEVARHLEQQYGISLTDAGIYNWVKRFTKEVVDQARQYTPDVGDVWVADETVLKIGGQNVWFWDIMDTKTRFLLASHISTKRTIQDALLLMKLAEARAGKIPKLVLTDKLASYLDGIEQAWGADAKHIPSKGFQAPMNTNLIERFHGSLKDRTKVMRGMRKVKTAQILLNGWLVHYNFFRPHEGLDNRTPAEKAGIKFPYKDWMDVARGVKEIKQEVDSEEPELKVALPRASPTSQIKRKHSKRTQRKVLKPITSDITSLKGIRM